MQTRVLSRSWLWLSCTGSGASDSQDLVRHRGQEEHVELGSDI